MADFSALKTAIQTYIKQNGNEEITGEILQEILLSVVTTLGDTAINNLVTALADEVAARQNADVTLQQNITNEATARGNADTALSNRLGSTITAENTAAAQIGAEAEAREAADTALQGLIDGITDNIENGYVYAGIATPSSTPTTGKVFYLALTAGTYTNFGNTEVSQGINILKYNGSAWSIDVFIGIDDTPTPSSNNLVKSGGVYEEISQLDNRTINLEDIFYQNDYLTSDNVEVGKYIKDDGSIDTGISSYRLLKFYIKKENRFKYRLINSHPRIAKYTDSTYSVLDSIIKGAQLQNITEYITLSVGYYAISSNDIGDFFNNIPYINIQYTDKIIWEKADDFKFQGYYNDNGELTNGSRLLTDYISVNEGDTFKYQLINTSAISKIVEFNNGIFVRGIKTDSDYGIYVVPSGVTHVRFCGMSSNPNILIVGKSVKDEIVSKNSGEKVRGFGSFTPDAYWTIDGDTAYTTANTPLIRNKSTFEDSFVLSAKMAVEGDTYKVWIGKVGGAADPNVSANTSSTLFSIYHSVSEDYIQPYKVDSVSPLSADGKERYTVTGVDLSSAFNVSIEKYVTNEVNYKVTITDKYGSVFSVTIPQTKNGADNIGAAWGAIYIAKPMGSSLTVSELSFCYKEDPDLIILGHSFVEGNSMITDKDKRYASLIKANSDLSVQILGKGGDNTALALEVYPQYCDWFKNALYALINLGTNDGLKYGGANTLNFLFNAIKLSTIFANKGIIPIWLGNIPTYDDNTSEYVIDAGSASDEVLRKLYRLIDIRSIFLNANGTVNESLFQNDHIHPTVAAHQRIYNAIVSQATYLLG